MFDLVRILLILFVCDHLWFGERTSGWTCRSDVGPVVRIQSTKSLVSPPYTLASLAVRPDLRSCCFCSIGSGDNALIASRMSLIFSGLFGDGGGCDLRNKEGDLVLAGMAFDARFVSIGAGTLRSLFCGYG